MKKNIIVAPSILSADFTKLGSEIKKAEDAGAGMIHIDVMDGRFVPNITIGPFIVEAIRRCTSLLLDAHLMIEGPHRFIKDFVDAGADIITIHAEAYSSEKSGAGRKGMSKSTDRTDEARVKEVLAQIRSFGKKAGVSLNPDSSLCIQGLVRDVDMILLMSVHPGFSGQKFIDYVLPKIKEARNIYSGDIEVDGGINDKTAGPIIEAGANVLVTGSYFFNSKNPKEAIRKLREARQPKKG